jgi:hypothetical protein
MRAGYSTKPYEKKMEVYQNFAGGLNTTSVPDNMNDSELSDMMNQDIGERGSLKRRHGFKKLTTMYKTTVWSDIGGKKWSEL